MLFCQTLSYQSTQGNWSWAKGLILMMFFKAPWCIPTVNRKLVTAFILATSKSMSVKAMLEQSTHYLTVTQFLCFPMCVCVCQSLARGRGLCTETVRSGSPASVPDASAITEKPSVRLQSVSKWRANRWVWGNINNISTGSNKGSVAIPLCLLCSNSISWLA